VSVVHLAAPRLELPGGQVPSWGRTTHVWRGWDGSEWPLHDPSSGVFLMRGVRGMGVPPVTRFTSESAATNGSRFRGHRTDARECFWPIYLYSDDGSEAWRERDAAFHRTLLPDRVGTWTVQMGDAAPRWLPLRFVDDGQHTFELDPGHFGWQRYGFTFMADEPFWLSEPITRSWAPAAPVDFFNSPDGAPPFHISSSNTLETAEIDNPGDVPTWPVWTIHGPTDSVSVGVGGRQVSVPVELLAGEWWTIDTNPTAQTAFDQAGNERTEDLGLINFAPIPPGESRELSLNMVGAGSVSVSLQPRFRRAW
jgi:hypothetical protein